MPGTPEGTARPGGFHRIITACRLVHPFPSVLDGVVVAVVATVAGAGQSLAVALGLSMTLLQFSIGALNDLVDAQADAGHKPGKPIPAGIVSPAAARIVVLASAASGLLLALACAQSVALLAVVGLLIGVAYDLRLKGTALSWLPLAIGIPLLPVYGWVGATGSLPALFLVVLPAAAVAGAALAIANALVDRERDGASGTGSVAIALGARRASLLVVVLDAAVGIIVVSSAVVLGASPGWVTATLLAALVPLGGAVLGAVAARRSAAEVLELAWEVQAVGTGLLAVAWLGAVSASAGAI